MKDFKIGQKVWSIQKGWGEVVSIGDYEKDFYPVIADFNDELVVFTRNGYILDTHHAPSLFHEKPDCFKEKKIIEVKKWVNIYKSRTDFFGSEIEALNSASLLVQKNNLVAKAVVLTGEYETYE